MKNTMTKLAGIALVSTTMLLSSAVIADPVNLQSVSDKEPKHTTIEIVEYGTKTLVSIITFGNIVVSFDDKVYSAKATNFANEVDTVESKEESSFSYITNEAFPKEKPQLEEYKPVSWVEKKVLGEDNKVYINEDGNYIIHK